MRAEAEGAEDTARRAAGAQESETLTSLLFPQRPHNHRVNPSVVPAQQGKSFKTAQWCSLRDKGKTFGRDKV